MDWVHCNSCFFQPAQVPKRSFVLTSCGHIFCQYCERPGTIEQCKICGVKCTTTPLTANMIPDVQMYFEDPESDLEKLMQVMKFQVGHRQRLNENYRKVVVKYKNLQIAYQKQQEELQRTKNELDKYKRTQNLNMLTPTQPQSLPLFCKNSQTSKAIRSGNSQSGISSSPFFVTPSPQSHTRRDSSSQMYRYQNAIHSPVSDISSISPASITSPNYRGSQMRLNSLANSQQRSYKTNLTPPISGLKLMSFPHTPKNGTRY